MFSVLEECDKDRLEEREQFYVDMLKPALNAITDIRRRRGKEQGEKIVASIKKRAAARTHCPRGHEYTPENTYLGKKVGDKRCKACNRERVAKIYSAETPEQTRARLDKCNANYYAKREEKRVKQKEYASAHREEKRLYDIAYRPIKNARRQNLVRIV